VELVGARLSDVVNDAAGVAAVLGAEVVGDDTDAVNEVEDDVKTELGKSLKDALDGVVTKIKDAVDHGQKVAQELVDKARDIASKLQELGGKAAKEAQTLLESLKEKAGSLLGKILESLFGTKEKREVEEGLDLNSLLTKVKDALVGNLNFDDIVEYIQKLFGNASALAKNFIETLKQKGVEALQSLVEKVLNVFGGKDTRDLKDIANKVTDFFSGLGKAAQEKFAEFAGWIRDLITQGKELAGEKLEKLKAVAREVLEHANTLKEEVAREALEFLRPYKDQLGSLFGEVVDALKKTVKGE